MFVINWKIVNQIVPPPLFAFRYVGITCWLVGWFDGV